MPYELLEREIEGLSEAQQRAVVLFVRFLSSQGKNLEFVPVPSGGFTSMPLPAPNENRRVIDRKLGGFEDGFHISPDFDDPIPDFAEYM